MADSPIQLIIRFTTLTPDFPLPIPSPQTTTILALKQKIRGHLPPSTSSNRLRLIHAGKVLPDTALLSSALPIPRPPPSNRDVSSDELAFLDSDNSEKTAKSKGKEPVRDGSTANEIKASKSLAWPKIYIHCSIGDALAPAELEAEAHAAFSSINVPPTQISRRHSPPPLHPSPHVSIPPPQHQQQPLGFDRLLSANFTREDVASLRAQFLALQQHTHTPDTMPNGRELRLLEERWLESEAFGPPTSGGAAQQSGTGDSGGPVAVAEGGGIIPAINSGVGWGIGAGAGFGDDGGLEDILIGNLMGFFWPLGALCWLLREEGVWTQRRQIAVFTGMVVNAAFGFWRMAG